MKTFLIIDSHALIYRFFYALPPLTSSRNEPVGAVFGLARLILNIFNPSFGEKPDYLAATFDRPEETFRTKIYKEYKIQRPKPSNELISQFNVSRELFQQFNIKVVEEAGYEADDLIGTLVEKFKSDPDLKIIILSGDRDILQLIEGDKVLVNLIKKGLNETELYNERAVFNRYGLKPKQLLDLKGILGDASDNIPGVKGIGPKTATPLIKKYGNLENLFENLWEISDKIGAKLEAQKETAFLSKELSTIKRDVPLKFNSLDDFKLLPYDKNKISQYFISLGFNSLVDRI